MKTSSSWRSSCFNYPRILIVLPRWVAILIDWNKKLVDRLSPVLSMITFPTSLIKCNSNFPQVPRVSTQISVIKFWFWIHTRGRHNRVHVLNICLYFKAITSFPNQYFNGLRRMNFFRILEKEFGENYHYGRNPNNLKSCRVAFQSQTLCQSLMWKYSKLKDKHLRKVHS